MPTRALRKYVRGVADITSLLPRAPSPSCSPAEKAEWLPKLDAEADNLRAALEWSVIDDPALALALRLAGQLAKFLGYPQPVRRGKSLDRGGARCSGR
jgi:hypothetical protein